MNQGIISTVHGIASYAKEKKIAHLATEDELLTHNLIQLDGEHCVNFGSCSYLGLEFDPRLKVAAKKAIDDYGTQFSASRAYVSPRYYEELESKLSQIFDAPTIVSPTTTLGHMAAIPVLVKANDAVILDHQVHNSVQTAVSLLKAGNIHVELVRHNRMDLLEEKIIKLSEKYDNVWYMADGIYSMFGDAAPVDDIYSLLNRHPKFHFYVDDAHGMSCFGKNGRGYVLDNRKIHPKMVMATSFAKAFATGGGALVFPTKELAQKVRNCGGPLITSGPMQPSALGAAVAAADIHLSPDIEEYKEDLQQNILYTNLMLKKCGLPNLASDFSPIYFIPVGIPKVGYNLIHRMKAAGHFMNIGIFPAVPIKNTGVRFTITRLHTFEQIRRMVEDLAKNYPEAIAEENFSLEQIYKAFKMKAPEAVAQSRHVAKVLTESSLKVTLSKTINDIDKSQWNELFKGKGTYDWNGLKLIEDSFTNNLKSHQNWDFDYIIISDVNDEVVLATYLTTSLAKDDMLSPKEVSADVERRRLKDPLYMTSRTLSIGSPMTEGNHLYLNKSLPSWKTALGVLFNRMAKIQEASNVQTVMLRDLPANDLEMDQLMVDNGFVKIGIPNNMVVENLNWTDEPSFFAQLSKNGKRHFRKNISRNEDLFEYKLISKPTKQEVDHFYSLYQNVKNKSLELNTFELPRALFNNIADSEDWEFISINFKDDSLADQAVAMAACHKSKKQYSFVLAGNNYDFTHNYGCYRHLLNAIVQRAAELSADKLVMGYTSEVEKKRFGAVEKRSCAYVQIKDHYSMQALDTMNVKQLNVTMNELN